MILLIISYVFSLLLSFFFYQTVILQKKEEHVNIYGHILYIIIHVCICFYIFIFILIWKIFYRKERKVWGLIAGAS